MPKYTSSECISLQEIYRPVQKAIEKLVNQLRGGYHGNGELDDLMIMLESLPLSTDEFGLAFNRLMNARGYLISCVCGAAIWELNALRRQLCSRITAEAAVPRLRRHVKCLS